MRLRRRNATEASSAVPGAKRSRAEESEKVAQTRAPKLESKTSGEAEEENGDTNTTEAGANDENNPVNCSDRNSRRATRGAADSLSNVNILGSRSRSRLRSREPTVAGASKVRSIPSGEENATKEPEGGKATVKTANQREDEQRADPATITVPSGNKSCLATSSRSQKASGSKSKAPLQEPKPCATSAEDHVAEQTIQGGGGQAVAENSSPSNSRSFASPKTFYGEGASSSGAENIQERLKEFSFSQRASFGETPPWGEAPNRRRNNARPKAFKAAAKKKVKNNGCRPPLILMGSSIAAASGADGKRSLESNKFFKHHIPLGLYRCVIRGGISRIETIPQKKKKKGLIDFEFKEDNITHVAEEGGKCSNFGLASIDDLERSGIPRVSVLQENRFNLRKRKSSVTNDQAPHKRRRASSWRYTEEDVPVGSFSNRCSPRKVSDGHPPESLGEFHIKTRDIGVVLMRQPFRSKRAQIAAKAHDESTILVAREKPKPGETKDASSRNKLETNRAGTSRDTAPWKSAPEPEVENPSRESSPVGRDSIELDFSPAVCDSPLLSPYPYPLKQSSSPAPPQSASISTRLSRPRATPAKPVHSNLPGPSSAKSQSRSAKPYNPQDDAFGFNRMKFKARQGLENPFVEVVSPTKKPKELTPKIMTPKNTQPSVMEVLNKGSETRVTSTPTKSAASFLISEVSFAKTKTQYTSTPLDPTVKPSFYGASTLKGTSTDGFRGLRRLIDRFGSKQLQIDAGQKKYGAKECESCGMVFSQGEAEDEREHQKFHKQMTSVLQVKSLGTCRVVDVLPGVGRVVLVSAQDSKRVKEKLSDVLEFANRTVGLDSEVVLVNFHTNPERMFAAFIHDSGRIVSVIGAEPCSLAHRTIPGQGLMVDTSERHHVKSSIFFIWTLPEFRRKGLAGLLLFRMRSILRAQCEPLTFEELAFADLTPDLHKFVTALSGKDTVLVAAPPDPKFEALL